MAPIYDPKRLADIAATRARKEAQQRALQMPYPEQLTTPLYNLPPALGAAARNLLSWLTPSFIRESSGVAEPVRRHCYAIATKTSDNLYTVDFVHEASGIEHDQMIKHDNAGAGVRLEKAIQLLQQYETQMIARCLPREDSDFDNSDYKRSKIFCTLVSAGKARDPVKDAGPDYMRPTSPIVF